MLTEDKLVHTTEEHFQTFKFNVNYWIDYFSLRDWVYDIRHQDPNKGDFQLAGVTADLESGYAIFSLNTETPEDLLNEREIMFAAFHEVCELLLMEPWILAQQRHETSEERMTTAWHKVIHRLTNTIFEDSYQDYLDEQEPLPEETEMTLGELLLAYKDEENPQPAPVLIEEERLNQMGYEPYCEPLGKTFNPLGLPPVIYLGHNEEEC